MRQCTVPVSICLFLAAMKTPPSQYLSCIDGSFADVVQKGFEKAVLIMGCPCLSHPSGAASHRNPCQLSRRCGMWENGCCAYMLSRPWKSTWRVLIRDGSTEPSRCTAHSCCSKASIIHHLKTGLTANVEAGGWALSSNGLEKKPNRAHRGRVRSRAAQHDITSHGFSWGCATYGAAMQLCYKQLSINIDIR